MVVSLRTAALGIAAVFAALVGAIVVAPPFVSLVLTLAIAGAWCVWLDKHPDSQEALSEEPLR